MQQQASCSLGLACTSQSGVGVLSTFTSEVVRPCKRACSIACQRPVSTANSHQESSKKVSALLGEVWVKRLLAGHACLGYYARACSGQGHGRACAEQDVLVGPCLRRLHKAS